jgi:sulfotransferase family protein
MAIDRPFSVPEAGRLLKQYSSAVPDYLIIGAPKAGTTWLASNLAHHPDIYLPPEKELKYFSSNYMRFSADWYANQFASAGTRIKGEASPSYYALPRERIRFVQELMPRAKLIYLLREPTSRVWSDVRHFFTTTRREDMRDVPVSEILEYGFSDGPILASTYERFLRRWSSSFDPRQMFVGFYDDLVANPRKLLSDVLDFLGVRPITAWEGFPVRDVINAGPSYGVPERLQRGLLALFRPQLDSLNELLTTNWRKPLPASWFGADAQVDESNLYVLTPADKFSVFIFQGRFYASGTDSAPHALRPADIEMGLKHGEIFDGASRSEVAYKAGLLHDLFEKHLAGVVDNEVTDVDMFLVAHGYFRHNLVFYRDAYYALHWELGDVDLRALSAEDISSHMQRGRIIVSKNLDALRRQIAPRWLRDVSRSGTESDLVPVNAVIAPEAETERYNLVRVGDKFVAVARSLGHVSLLSERIGERDLPPVVFVGDSLEEVRQRALQVEKNEAFPGIAIVGETQTTT